MNSRPNTPPPKSDGCTLWPDGLFGKNQWKGCCVKHDKAYYYGGSKRQRKNADILLLICVASKGFPIIGCIMYIGVRIFGAPFWPTRFRWGFGRKYLKSATYKQQGDYNE